MTGPVNSDGTPAYGQIKKNGSASTSGATTPGQANIWNFPAVVYAADKKGQTLVYETKDTTQQVWQAGLPEGVTIPETTAKDVKSTPSQVMAQVAAMSENDPAKFMAIQEALASGVWGTVHITGSWDPETSAALAKAMGSYWQMTQGAQTPISFKKWLLGAAATAYKLNPQAAQAAPTPPTYNVTDPEAIKAAAQSAAQAALGQGMSDAQLQQFVSQFQSAQLGAEKQVGGTATAPDLQAQAMQFAQQADPKTFHDNQRAAFTDALVNMLNPAGGASRPAMTPVPSV